MNSLTPLLDSSGEYRSLRCRSPLQHLGFSNGRPSGLSSIQRVMENLFHWQLGLAEPTDQAWPQEPPNWL